MIFALGRLTKRNETISMRGKVYVRGRVKGSGERRRVCACVLCTIFKGTVLAGNGFPHLSCRKRNVHLL